MIKDYWGCRLEQNNENYIARCEEWTNSIPANGSVKFGFVATVPESLEPIADHFALSDYEINYDFDSKENAEIELYSEITELQMSDKTQNIVVYAYTDYEVPEILVYDKESGDLVGKLVDDGRYEQSYDDMQGDGVYSGLLDIVAMNENSITLVARYENEEVSLLSNELVIDVYKLLTEDDFKNIHLVVDKISEFTNSEDYLAMEESERYVLIASLLDEIAENGIDGNLDASIKKDSIVYTEESGVFAFEYSCGGIGYVSIYNYIDGTSSGAYEKKSIFSSDILSQQYSNNQNIHKLETKNTQRNRNAIVIDMYGNKTVNTTLSQLSVNWSNIGVDTEYVLEPSIADLKNKLQGYTYIYLGIHGEYAAVSGSSDKEALLNTNEKSNYSKDYNYAVDISTGRIIIDNNSQDYSIRGKFFEKYYSGNKLNGSVVFCESCSGLGVSEYEDDYDSKLGDSFIASGAECVFGFTNIVYSDYARELFSEILSNMEKGSTSGESFKKAKEKCGSNSSVWKNQTGYDIYQAAFPHLIGRTNYVTNGDNNGYTDGDNFFDIVLDELSNPSFEDVKQTVNGTGLIKYWKTNGDSRLVRKLGGLKPQDGKYMLMISTGIGSAESKYTNGNEGSYVSQSFVVPSNAQTLSFSYDVISEEPLEYVNSQYDDKFDVFIVSESEEEKIVEESINKSDWYKIMGVDFAGGDSTVYHTQWNRYDYDISKYRGKTIKLVFSVSDVGDSLYDTAALIDDISMK